MSSVSSRRDNDIDAPAPMLPLYFWLFPVWPLLLAAHSARWAATALGASSGSAEIIPFPAHRIRRRAVG